MKNFGVVGPFIFLLALIVFSVAFGEMPDSSGNEINPYKYSEVSFMFQKYPGLRKHIEGKDMIDWRLFSVIKNDFNQLEYTAFLDNEESKVFTK